MFSRNFKAALVGIGLILCAGKAIGLIFDLNNARIAFAEKRFLTEYPSKAIENVFAVPPAPESSQRLLVTENEQVGWAGAPYGGRNYRAKMRLQAAQPLKFKADFTEVADTAFVTDMLHSKGLCRDVQAHTPELKAYSGNWGTHSATGEPETHSSYVLALPKHTYCVFYQFSRDP